MMLISKINLVEEEITAETLNQSSTMEDQDSLNSSQPELMMPITKINSEEELTIVEIPNQSSIILQDQLLSNLMSHSFIQIPV